MVEIRLLVTSCKDDDLGISLKYDYGMVICTMDLKYILCSPPPPLPTSPKKNSYGCSYNTRCRKGTLHPPQNPVLVSKNENMSHWM